MNKKEVIEKLKKELSLDDDKINKINKIFENNSFVGKINKEKILKELMSKLSIDEKTANKIYNKVISVLGNGLKDKIKSLFK